MQLKLGFLQHTFNLLESFLRAVINTYTVTVIHTINKNNWE